MDIPSINSLAGTITSAPVEVASSGQALANQRELIHAVKAVNATGLFGQDNELTFILDRATKRAVVRIINRDTREVIQQIPAEYVLRLAEDSQGK